MNALFEHIHGSYSPYGACVLGLTIHVAWCSGTEASRLRRCYTQVPAIWRDITMDVYLNTRTAGVLKQGVMVPCANFEVCWHIERCRFLFLQLDGDVSVAQSMFG